MNRTSNGSRSGQYLNVLLDGIAKVDTARNPFIQEVSLDSRDVQPGSLFFAVPGLIDDGRSHIKSAITAGASAIVYESEGWQIERIGSTPQIGVPDLSRKISAIADLYFRHPSKKVHVVGITGTNGKSSCAVMTAQALESLGHRCGIVGTLGYGFPDELAPIPLTTPDSISLQRYLAQLVSAGAQSICLEVSSHALDQSRTDGVRFGTVVFTNLSQDHLDYHRNMEDYRAAKSKLFTRTDASHAVLNIDDDFGRSLLGRTSAEQEVTYGEQSSDIQLVNCSPDERGLSVSIRIHGELIAVRSKLLGRISGINLTTVAAVLHSFGISNQDIEESMHAIEPIPGRLERIYGASHFPSVYVDYAHTPDGLQQALNSVREITRGSLWCVFGCGGERDKEKRPLMGAIAEHLADRIIVTDDNPRNEDPETIADDITSQMKDSPLIIHDRRQAIAHAISQADAEDSVLIAGKGHETMQICARKSIAFSDRQVSEELLRGQAC